MRVCVCVCVCEYITCTFMLFVCFMLYICEIKRSFTVIRWKYSL